MKTHPKLKTQPRPLFTCGLFGHCTDSVLSPTTPQPPPLSPPPPPLPPPSLPSPPPPPPQRPTQPSSSSSSSSASTSQSFTQWRFPLPTSPPPPSPPPLPPPSPSQPPLAHSNIQELFHLSILHLTNGSLSEQISTLHLLERSLVPNPPSDPACPLELMRVLVPSLKQNLGAKPATKVLLALCLAEPNRHVAVTAGAVGAIIEVAPELEPTAAERALAALELMCTVAEGAAAIRSHALAVPVLVTMMGNMAGRGREYAISVLAVIYGGVGICDGGASEEEGVIHAPPEEVARAVVLALQGDCTARGRRKGAQLLKILQDCGRLDLTQYGR